MSKNKEDIEDYLSFNGISNYSNMAHRLRRKINGYCNHLDRARWVVRNREYLFDTREDTNMWSIKNG